MMMSPAPRQGELLAGVNGGLVVASFLAAMTSSLLVPWLSQGVSRLMEAGLPRLEITLPDTDLDLDLNLEVEDDKEEDTEMEEMEEAATKLKASKKKGKDSKASKKASNKVKRAAWTIG